MVWLRVPLSIKEEDQEADAAWLAWSAFRTMCHHHPKLVPALELTADLPAPSILNRWRAEQVSPLSALHTSVSPCFPSPSNLRLLPPHDPEVGSQSETKEAPALLIPRLAASGTGALVGYRRQQSTHDTDIRQLYDPN